MLLNASRVGASGLLKVPPLPPAMVSFCLPFTASNEAATTAAAASRKPPKRCEDHRTMPIVDDTAVVADAADPAEDTFVRRWMNSR